jgi:hypothetical protein
VVISSLFKVAKQRTIPVVLLHLFYKGTSSEEFDDALSAQCDGDVLQTKLITVKIEDENNYWNCPCKTL